MTDIMVRETLPHIIDPVQIDGLSGESLAQELFGNILPISAESFNTRPGSLNAVKPIDNVLAIMARDDVTVEILGTKKPLTERSKTADEYSSVQETDRLTSLGIDPATLAPDALYVYIRPRIDRGRYI